MKTIKVPSPKFDLGQEVWFGGFEKQYNGYVKSVKIGIESIQYDNFSTISYEIEIASNNLINKNETEMYATRDELIERIKQVAKELKIRLTNPKVELGKEKKDGD